MYNVCTIMYTHIRSQASDWNCCAKRLFLCAQQFTSLILVHIMRVIGKERPKVRDNERLRAIDKERPKVIDNERLKVRDKETESER